MKYLKYKNTKISIILRIIPLKKPNFNSFYIGYVKFRKFSNFEESQSKKKKLFLIVIDADIVTILLYHSILANYLGMSFVKPELCIRGRRNPLSA